MSVRDRKKEVANDTGKCLFIFRDSIFFKRFRQCLFEWRSLLKNFHWIVSNWTKVSSTQSLMIFRQKRFNKKSHKEKMTKNGRYGG